MNRCKDCVRYNPKAVGNCRMAQSVANLEKKYGFKLSVFDCPFHAPPREVFATRVWSTNDSVCDCEDYTKYGHCECEREG